MIKLLLHTYMVILMICWLVVATLTKIVTLPNAIWLGIDDSFRKWLHKLPHSQRKHLPYYDSCGLRHSYDHINSINVVEFFTRSFEDQAEYASEFIDQFCESGERSIDNNTAELPKLHYNDINVTGIANAAYVILNHPSMEERETAYKTLDDIEKLLNR